MSLQRDREQRIVEKLQTGRLRLATAADTLRSQAGGSAPCQGCDETETDATVADRPWHSLCILFWQGRSAAIRGERIPHTQPGPGVHPDRPRWVIVVSVDRPEAFATLQRSFARSAWVNVVMDRRRGDRRRGAGAPPTADRRTGGRRGADRDPAQVPAYRLAYRTDGATVYEATRPESARCPECGAPVSVELPRFVEPPVRLELVVIHERVAPDRARHVVELQSFSPTGRVLLATRLVGRTESERG